MNKLLWFLPLVMLFIGCQKEISFEVPTANGTSNGTSVYTLGSSGSSCTGAIVNGTYTNGAALSAANTVVINVTVTTIGTYTISTTTVNGMTFTASGTFTSTGPQTILLTGSGTPLAVATSSISVMVGTSSCTFSVPVVAAGPPATYTIAGAGSACTGSSVGGTFSAGTALTSSNTATIQVNVTVVGSYKISTNAVNGYSFTGTGTFTTLGAQSVILTGSGTPTAVGTNTLTAGTGGCTFDVVVGAAPIGTGKITCTIAGVAKTFNTYAAGSLSNGSSLLSIGGQVAATSQESITINVADLTGGGTPIAVGTYTVSTSNIFRTVLVTYGEDIGGTQWITGVSGLSSDPRTVTITSITTTNVKGTFTATVRDGGGQGNNTKNITSGTFDVPIQ